MHAKVIVPTLLLAASANVGAVQYKRAAEFEVQAKRDVNQFFQNLGNTGNEVGNVLNGILAALPSDLATPASSFLAEATPAVSHDFDNIKSFVEQIFGKGAAPGAPAPGAPAPGVPTPVVPTPVTGTPTSTDALGQPPAVVATPATATDATTAPPTAVTPPARRGFMDDVSSILNQLPTEIAHPAKAFLNDFQAGLSSGLSSATPTPTLSSSSDSSTPTPTPTSSSDSSTPTPTAPPTSSSASSTDSATSTSSTPTDTSSPSPSSNAAVGNLSFSRGSLISVVAVIGSVLLGSIVAF